MNVSLILGRISLVATAITTGATFLNYVKPAWSVYALAIAAALNAFTERVQGGKSKQ